MIISLRGTNGSGKTTAVRELMRMGPPSPIFGLLGTRKPEAYKIGTLASGPVYVLGPYDTVSACGFDGVTNYEHVLALVRKYAAKGHVVFEGLITGKLWGRLGALLEELAPKHGVALLYLDTPLDECIRRVVERRRARGDNRPFNEKNLRAVYAAVRANMANVQDMKIEGVSYEEVSSDRAADRCLELLRDA